MQKLNETSTTGKNKTAQLLNQTSNINNNKTAQLLSQLADNSSSLQMSPRMYRGQEVDWTAISFTAQVLLWNEKTKWKFQCTGFLVTRQIVVTSNRCLDRWDGDITDVIIRLAHDWGKVEYKYDAGKWYRTLAVFRHPGFKETRASVDLALIKTDVLMESGDSAKPLKLLLMPKPNETEPWVNDGEVTLKVVGFGTSFGDDWEKGHRLRHEEIKLHKDRCLLDWMIVIDTTHQLCGKLDHYRLCWGDHGAPIYAEMSRGTVAIAMVSRTLYYCSEAEHKKNDAIIASRLEADMPWILSRIKKHTVNHGLEDLIKQWEYVEYPKDVLADESMDIIGELSDFPS